jgi:inorganic pyrophosphatase
MARDFWADVDRLVQRHRVVVDRAANSAHPLSPQHVYPLDYGYLEGTRSNEIKLLLGCSSAEIAMVRDFCSQLQMGCRVWLRD